MRKSKAVAKLMDLRDAESECLNHDPELIEALTIAIAALCETDYQTYMSQWHHLEEEE